MHIAVPLNAHMPTLLSGDACVWKSTFNSRRAGLWAQIRCFLRQNRFSVDILPRQRACPAAAGEILEIAEIRSIAATIFKINMLCLYREGSVS